MRKKSIKEGEQKKKKTRTERNRMSRDLEEVQIE